MSKELKKFGPYDHLQVMNFLPHRFPFLFVDKILAVEVPIGPDSKIQQVGTKVVGIKNATINEPYFTGHFPGVPLDEVPEDVRAGTTSGDTKLKERYGEKPWYDFYDDDKPVVFGHSVVGSSRSSFETESSASIRERATECA